MLNKFLLSSVFCFYVMFGSIFGDLASCEDYTKDTIVEVCCEDPVMKKLNRFFVAPCRLIEAGIIIGATAAMFTDHPKPALLATAFGGMMSCFNSCAVNFLTSCQEGNYPTPLRILTRACDLFKTVGLGTAFALGITEGGTDHHSMSIQGLLITTTVLTVLDLGRCCFTKEQNPITQYTLPPGYVHHPPSIYQHQPIPHRQPPIAEDEDEIRRAASIWAQEQERERARVEAERVRRQEQEFRERMRKQEEANFRYYNRR